VEQHIENLKHGNWSYRNTFVENHSILLIVGVEFELMIADTQQRFKVKGQGHSMT